MIYKRLTRKKTWLNFRYWLTQLPKTTKIQMGCNSRRALRPWKFCERLPSISRQKRCATRALACVASVSVRFSRSKERGTRVKDRAKNRKSRSSGFFCSETKRKRLPRRLYEFFPRGPGLSTAFARASLIKTMENGSSSRFVVSILLSERFKVKKLSWCLFCHSLFLHLNDDTRQNNIFSCRVPDMTCFAAKHLKFDSH